MSDGTLFESCVAAEGSDLSVALLRCISDGAQKVNDDETPQSCAAPL